MRSAEIQELVYQWALQNMNEAPYGVLSSEHTSKLGKKYKSVTFGRPRTLDVEVQIYHKNFMVVRASNRYDNIVVNNKEELMAVLVGL